MPIKSCRLPDGGSGFQWGNHGKCYADRAGAERQAAAAHAAGFHEKVSLCRLVGGLGTQPRVNLAALLKQNGDGPGQYDIQVISGLEFVCETKAGERRRPEWPPMTDDYGYLLLADGADGDRIDAYVRQNTPQDWTGDVYVIDQHVDGTFDEHKVMIGWPDEESAKAAYTANYTEGWQGLNACVAMSLEDFKAWAHSEAVTRPAAEKNWSAPTSATSGIAAYDLERGAKRLSVAQLLRPRGKITRLKLRRRTKVV